MIKIAKETLKQKQEEEDTDNGDQDMINITFQWAAIYETYAIETAIASNAYCGTGLDTPSGYHYAEALEIMGFFDSIEPQPQETIPSTDSQFGVDTPA